MDMQRSRGWTRMIAIALPLLVAQAATAQTFSSGATGDEEFDAQATVGIDVKAGGVYQYKKYTVGPGVTVFYNRGPDNAPVVILVSGDVQIDGTIVVSGANATPANGVTPVPGGRGGPGGFNGGNGGLQIGSTVIFGAQGQGPAGGAPAASLQGQGAQQGNYGAPDSFEALVPLFGGSGGGGGYPGGAGDGGGGGGGAILIASSTQITVNGAIKANGGHSGTTGNGTPQARAGSGSGGAIRLVAPTITGGVNSQLQAIGGSGYSGAGGAPDGGPGRIRIEAFTRNFNGLANPTAITSNVPGPVSPGGNPVLANVPTLAIARVGPTDVPTTTTASYSLPDITLPPGTGPVPVRIDATNTPVGGLTQITVRLMPRGISDAVSVVATGHAGTFANSSATANVDLTAGEVTVLQAQATMQLTGQVASLFPLIDGEPVERVTLAATLGTASTLSLLTKSGKERRLDQLPLEDQMRVARAWDAIKATRTE